MLGRVSGYFKQFVAEVIGSPKLQEEGLQEVKQDVLETAPLSPSDAIVNGEGAIDPVYSAESDPPPPEHGPKLG